jgi:hypothetical protein
MALRPFEVRRLSNDGFATLGAMCVFAQTVANTLEDAPRPEKIKGQTRIPAGRYPVTLKKYGGFHARYSELFPSFHMGMIQLHDVPGFSEILIHCGNYHTDTDGCVLIGERPSRDAQGHFAVAASRVAYSRVYPMIGHMMVNKLITHIEVVDEGVKGNGPD